MSKVKSNFSVPSLIKFYTKLKRKPCSRAITWIFTVRRQKWNYVSPQGHTFFSVSGLLQVWHIISDELSPVQYGTTKRDASDNVEVRTVFRCFYRRRSEVFESTEKREKREKTRKMSKIVILAQETTENREMPKINILTCKHSKNANKSTTFATDCNNCSTQLKRLKS